MPIRSLDHRSRLRSATALVVTWLALSISGTVQAATIQAGDVTTTLGSTFFVDDASNGGSLAVTVFTRTSTSTSATSTLNLNDGTLRARGASTTFLEPLAGLQTVVKAGGAVIDSNVFNITITETNLDGSLTIVGEAYRSVG